jgi:ribosomal protein S27AE
MMLNSLGARSVKKSRKCPKCDSTDLLHFSGQTGPFGAGSNVPVGGSIFSAVPIDRYVCGACGFVEAWVVGSTQLKKLRKAAVRRQRPAGK